MLSINSERLQSILKMKGEEEYILGSIPKMTKPENSIGMLGLLESRKEAESTMDWISSAWEAVNRPIDLRPLGTNQIVEISSASKRLFQ